MKGKLSPEQKAAAIADYLAGDSLKVVGERYGVTHGAVQLLLIKHGIPRRPFATRKRHVVHVERFAKRPVSPEAAYWAGFLLADGCVQRWSTLLGLQVRDRPHVERFRDFIGPTATVTDDSRGKSTVAIYGKDLVECLRRFGIVRRKSRGHPIPDLHLSEVPHFLRGYFDGDGSIYETRWYGRYPTWRLLFCGRRNFLAWVQDQLRTHADAGGGIREGKGCWRLEYNGAPQVGRILGFIAGEPRLGRKWERCDAAIALAAERAAA